MGLGNRHDHSNPLYSTGRRCSVRRRLASGYDIQRNRELPMTDHMMCLRTLIEKAPDADTLRKIISFAARGWRWRSLA